MTLSELKYVVAVSRERNFRRAAERCYVTQPALSLAILKLESELGVQIFERKKSEVSLTPVGISIVEQAIRVLEEADRVKEIARMGSSPLLGAIRIGLIYTVGPYLLPELIPELLKQAPGMPLEVEENTTANLEMHLKQGLIDVAVLALPFELPNVETVALYDEPFVIAVPSHHAWATRKSIAASELADQKVLLLNSGHCFSNQVNQACPELGKKGEVLQGNSLETIRNMVASGLGITVLPRSAASERYSNPLIKFIPFSDPVPTRRIALAWRKSFGRTDAVRVLADSVRAIKTECFDVMTN